MRRRTWAVIPGMLAVAILLAPDGGALAATLVLQDDTVIHGEIETLREGVYTVKTASLGTVRVRKEDVQTIHHGDGAKSPLAVGSPAQGAGRQAAGVEALQHQVAANPDLLSMIETLQNDSEVQAVLADPEIMRAVAAGDYGALMNHPKIVALTNNSKVREVIEAAK